MAEPTAEQKRIQELEAQLAARDKADAEARAAAEAQAEADKASASSETVPGGKYLQGDVWVNAEGEPLKGQK